MGKHHTATKCLKNYKKAFFKKVFKLLGPRWVYGQLVIQVYMYITMSYCHKVIIVYLNVIMLYPNIFQSVFCSSAYGDDSNLLSIIAYRILHTGYCIQEIKLFHTGKIVCELFYQINDNISSATHFESEDII